MQVHALAWLRQRVPASRKCLTASPLYRLQRGARRQNVDRADNVRVILVAAVGAEEFASVVPTRCQGRQRHVRAILPRRERRGLPRN
jgi:hypothetical protein